MNSTFLLYRQGNLGPEKEWQFALLFMRNIIVTTSTNHKEDIKNLSIPESCSLCFFYSSISPVTFQNKQMPMLLLGKRPSGGSEGQGGTIGNKESGSGSLNPHLTEKGVGGGFSTYLMKIEHGGYIIQPPSPPFQEGNVT